MEQALPLFVYGSLMRGLLHHDQMQGAIFVGPRRVRGYRLVLYEDAYPAMVRAAPVALHDGGELDRPVVGELYLVTAEHLERLDAFEDCPTLYQRFVLTLDDGASAQGYGISRDRAERYPDIGQDYRKFLGVSA